MGLENLNDKQLEAVKATEGPVLVLAGAGSGKTRVLTTRIAYLIKEKKVSPDSILAITFTNKAAKEMKERVIDIMGHTAKNIQISTFHSFGLLILKENYEKLGYKRNFTILDSDDSLTIIKKIIKELNYDPKIYNPNAIKSAISSSKNELINAENYERFVNSDFSDIVHKVYLKYEKKLLSSNCVDFDDLLTAPVTLFRNYPEILKEYQERYKYILIDEYQDTNEAQYVLTKLVSAKYKNICVVGDVDQTIFSWRGANYRNILNFEKDFPNANLILLEENYRSTQNILNAANDVIKNNKLRKDKILWTNNDSGLKIEYHRSYDEKDEAFYVASEIKKLIESGTEKKQIAVLYRTNAQSRAIEEAMLKENIPYKIVGTVNFYNRKEIKDLIAYLKLIFNEYDDVSLSRIINVPKRGIGLKTVENIIRKANDKSISMYDAIDSGKELEFKKLIMELKKESESLSLTELVEKVLEKTGIRQELLNEKTIEAELRIENLEEFKTIAKNSEEEMGVISLEDFLNNITLVSDVQEYKNYDDVVTLLTIHSSKGLEFENVFIIGMEEGVFPHKNSYSNMEELEEERRLCYVAITRAKKSLWFVNARRRTLYGIESCNPPSRFISEINDEYINSNISDINSLKVNIDSLVDENQEYQFGEKITHETFGLGIIVEMDKSVLTIAFPHPHGIKKILKGHKSIRKV
ncbi:MAG TPA: UvrD-helicase domain-containing protein [Tenericutes bacterium]|nr:UvrD-helicase domain-containing protein [Mycoplasmatota bacterium]